MSVGWIDNVYNNTNKVWDIKSVDDRHNGELKGGGKSFKLDDHQFHPLDPNTHYSASWAGIPWYYEGKHYKAIKLQESSNEVGFYTSEIAGQNYIIYEDLKTGRVIARQTVPTKSDFHAILRFENNGIYIEVVNNNIHTGETLLFEILDHLGKWVQVVLNDLAQAVGAAAGA